MRKRRVSPNGSIITLIVKLTVATPSRTFGLAPWQHSYAAKSAAKGWGGVCGW
jgi:hypothetical protein